MNPPEGVNPELDLIGGHDDTPEAFEPTPDLPPVAPRMIQRHSDDQDAREHAESWAAAEKPERVGERVVRFANPRGDAGPNPAFVRPLAPTKGDGTTRLSPPAFARIERASDDDPVGGYELVRIAIDEGTSLYGTGEQAGTLERTGRSVTAWTCDKPGYTDADEGLYQAHPWVLGVRADGSAFGILADTTHCCEIDLRAGVVFRSPGPPFGVVVIERDHPLDVVKALTELTGRIEMPPKWALGFQQSRWSYNPAGRVLEVARAFREQRLPCDVFWIDIDYMDGYRVFTFDREQFPDPRGLGAEMNELGIRVVWMLDPGIKADPGYPVFESCVAGAHPVMCADGTPFIGPVWPGLCVFPDFTRAETRAWWAENVRAFADACAFDGIWVDMNEPAVFSPHGTTTVRADVVHRADDDLGGTDSHERSHNLYGMQMARATQDAVRQAYPDRRPFVLTRSNFVGGHRYAATWTGDNASDWDHLRWTIPMILNMGVSGQAFVGCDIGGFIGDATPELFARWMGIGALLPFARAHSARGTRDHEPWAFGDQTLDVCRRALERRMRLMPTLYTLFHESATTGAPVCRPVFFADPADPKLRGAEASFLLGNDLLVRASVDEDGRPCPDPMPAGDWRALPIDENASGLPEVLIRAGAIVATGKPGMHVDELTDELVLMIAPDAGGRARGVLYEDAGDGHAWQQGERRITTFGAHAQGDGWVIETEVDGWTMPTDRAVTAVIVGPDRVERFEGVAFIDGVARLGG